MKFVFLESKILFLTQKNWIFDHLSEGFFFESNLKYNKNMNKNKNFFQLIKVFFIQRHFLQLKEKFFTLKEFS